MADPVLRRPAGWIRISKGPDESENLKINSKMLRNSSKFMDWFVCSMEEEREWGSVNGTAFGSNECYNEADFKYQGE